MKVSRVLLTIALLGQASGLLAQAPDSSWTLQRCIDQALQQNIQLQQSGLVNETDQQSILLAKAGRYPSLGASAGHSFSYSKQFDNTSGIYGDYADQQSSSYGVSSSVTLYNGFKTRYNIQRATVAEEASKFDTEAEKETLSLDVLDAYLQILYAEEQVTNAQKQVDVSTEELRLATERQNIGLISKADFLQVKSQLSSERSTLANAQKTLALSRVTLLQLLELPVSSTMGIVHPDIESLINRDTQVTTDSVFAKAAAIKPGLKSADLNVEYSHIGVKYARADYMPKLTLTGEVGTGYSSSLQGANYDYQVKNRVSPSVGLSLVIPIYQNRQVKTSVAKAQIAVKNAELSAQYSRNQLRKQIEQASVDVASAEKAYEASREEYESTLESYSVAAEKYSVGMISSVDFLVQKMSLISAESGMLQARYGLVFSYKTLDFYSGIPLSL